MKPDVKKIVTFSFIILFVAFSLVNAQNEKKPVTPEDYDWWQSLRRTAISANGEWLAYEVAINESADTLFVKNCSTDSTYKFANGSNPVFSKDSKWAAFTVGYSEDEIEKMRKSKKPVQNKMGLLNLETGEDVIVDDVQDFSFSETGKFIALKKYKPKEKKSKGADLILRNLEARIDLNLGNVAEYVFNKKGDYLACVIDAEGKSGNGVHLVNLKDNTVKVVDSNNESQYAKLQWNKEGTAFAFLRSFLDNNYIQENNSVITVRNLDTGYEKEVYDPAKDEAFPEDMRISPYRTPEWAEDNSAVFFGVMEWTKKPEDEKEEKKEEGKEEKGKGKEEKKEDEKPADVHVWHWKDVEIQPRQWVTARQDSTFSYTSVWNIDDNKFIQLADENLKDVYLTGDQKHAWGLNRVPYEPAFKVAFADIYIVDTKTGGSKMILKKQDIVHGSSPDGKYLLYFRDKAWWTYDIQADKHTNITAGIPSAFWNTEFDYPRNPKPPWGFGGWFKDDASVLIYDQYNVWNISPDGKKQERLTDGNADKIRFRITRLDTEEDYIDPSEPVYFSAFGDWSKKSGYFRLELGEKVEKLIFEDKYISALRKAKDAENYIYISMTYEQSPNVFMTGYDFNDSKRLTDTNPQQENFLWGKSELVEFRNADGVKLQGALFYPADYQQGKKYPMIVYIYQKLSQTVHQYVVPSKRRAYNTSVFSSLGYFVFRPDIIYEDRQPGVSAVKCVVPAVEKVLERGDIDETKLGLTGHSWGAYQTCYIITQSKLFSAASAGAPLTNMISMYSEVYWNTGVTNQVIFETSQGRFPDPFWKDMDNFILNSPVFNMQYIETPLLVEFGDRDGAVDWHQGIELFNGMRRLQKPMIMLVYPGENHGLRVKENMIDYAKRQIEFFGHYLKDEPAKEWIKEGIPFLEKKKINSQLPRGH